jgi:hypothetical protein
MGDSDGGSLMQRVRSALIVIPLVLVLAGCVPEPKPVATHFTTDDACAALEGAVTDFYEAASPGSTVEQMSPYDLPDVKGFEIPQPTCAFEMRPDPAVIPGDVFTIDSLYLDYPETMTQTLPEQLETAGFKRGDPRFATWAASKLGRSYSAAMLTFSPGDGQAYSEAAGRFTVLDLSLSQN